MLTRRILQVVATGVAVVGCAAEGPVEEAPPAATELLAGALDCAEAGGRLGRVLGDRELALEGAPGTFAMDDVNRVMVSGDAHAIDFAASVGVDAVLVHGGPTTRVYAYDGESRADEALTAAPMFRSGETRAITGVTFCYDHELAIPATASGAGWCWPTRPPRTPRWWPWARWGPSRSRASSATCRRSLRSR